MYQFIDKFYSGPQGKNTPIIHKAQNFRKQNVSENTTPPPVSLLCLLIHWQHVL